MFQDKYFRSWEGPYPFTDAEVTRVATAHTRKGGSSTGVYQILQGSQVMYVGISTSSIFDRLKKHVRGHGNWAFAHKVAPGSFHFVYFLCDGLSAKQIESKVTADEKPPFNVKTEYKNYISNITVH
ncbi:MAG: hypothetical protein MUF01_02970 [Bryobacterales bacterium]|jgi:hypothetical protein|nr:hypothetical protein [Bryobacterales bacterium]